MDGVLIFTVICAMFLALITVLAEIAIEKSFMHVWQKGSSS